MDYKALLSKKVAGVPVVWVLAVVAGIALYGALRLKRSPDPVEEPTDAAATDETGGDLPDTSQPVFHATPVIMQPSGVSSVASVPQDDTNELWASRAVQWLIAQGESYDVASSAITKFLGGETLSIEEGKARDRAIKQFGIPPEGLIAGSVTKPVSTAPAGYKGPATKQGVPPLTHTVKGTSDDSAAELARLYYGLDNADMIALIKQANTSVGKWPVPVGTAIRVPKSHRPKYYRATSAVNTLYRIARKNGTEPDRVAALNPGMNFPVKPGTRVRIW